MKEFEEEAMSLMENGDRPADDVAMELGLRRNHLYKWSAQLECKGTDVFSVKHGRPKKENHSELTALLQENESLKEELQLQGR